LPPPQSGLWRWSNFHPFGATVYRKSSNRGRSKTRRKARRTERGRGRGGVRGVEVEDEEIEEPMRGRTR